MIRRCRGRTDFHSEGPGYRAARHRYRHGPSSIRPDLNPFGGNDRRGSCQPAEGLGSVTSAPLCQAIGGCDPIVKK
jgi:hypothetical protein